MKKFLLLIGLLIFKASLTFAGEPCIYKISLMYENGPAERKVALSNRVKKLLASKGFRLSSPSEPANLNINLVNNWDEAVPGYWFNYRWDIDLTDVVRNRKVTITYPSGATREGVAKVRYLKTSSRKVNMFHPRNGELRAFLESSTFPTCEQLSGARKYFDLHRLDKTVERIPGIDPYDEKDVMAERVIQGLDPGDWRKYP